MDRDCMSYCWNILLLPPRHLCTALAALELGGLYPGDGTVLIMCVSRKNGIQVYAALAHWIASLWRSVVTLTMQRSVLFPVYQQLAHLVARMETGRRDEPSDCLM